MNQELEKKMDLLKSFAESVNEVPQVWREGEVNEHFDIHVHPFSRWLFHLFSMFLSSRLYDIP